MRFLHISDLHLGKVLNDVSFIDEQRYVLDQIADIAENEKVDAVLIAGDVYQRSSPQAEAMEIFDAFMTRLIDMKKQVFIISGNHDSSSRISYFASLIRASGVYVTERFDGRLQKYTLKDSYGDVNVWMLPFIRPMHVRRFFPTLKIETCDDAVRAIINNSDVDFSKRNILICHQFIAGAETCDSEEFTVGGLDNITSGVLDGFDFVAMGHIHKPQHITRETISYAGSPLKYSFSEVDHKKSVTVFEMMEKGCVEKKRVPIYPMRDLRVVDGLYDQLMRTGYSEDYVWVTIHDENPPVDARFMLSGVFPNMMKFSIVNSKTKFDMTVTGTEGVENKSTTELFTDFYRLQNNDQMPGEKLLSMLEKIIKNMEG